MSSSSFSACPPRPTSMHDLSWCDNERKCGAAEPPPPSALPASSMKDIHMHVYQRGVRGKRQAC